MYAGCIHAGTPLAMPHDGEYPNLAAESPSNNNHEKD